MKTIGRNWRALAAVLALGAVLIGVIAVDVFAQAPQPGLTISSLGSNSFSIVVTNGYATTNYELYWTPLLANPDYPWQLIAVGGAGITNFNVVAGDYPLGFFQVSLEQIYSGVPDYELADPNNPSLGALTITIDSPANGSNVN